MRYLGPATAAQYNAGLLVLRLALGAIFLAHGGQKLFGYGIDGTVGAFGQMGVPAPDITAPAVAAVEALAGLAVILGLFTRFAALGLAVVAIGAMFLVHLPNGFFLPNGIEFVLALAAMALTLTLTGAGQYSLDARLSQRWATSHRPRAHDALDPRHA